MKRVFRSIIDFTKNNKPTIPMDELIANYKNFLKSKINVGVPGDLDKDPFVKLYHWIEDHFREQKDIPSIDYINSKAEIEGEEGILGIIREIALETPLIGSNYKAILKEKYEEQNIALLGKIAQDTWTIANSGMDVKIGRRKRHLKGINEAIQYFGSNARELRLNQVDVKTDSFIRSVQDSKEVREAYRKRKKNPLAIMGMFTLIDKIDEIFKGTKLGDLFIIAAYVAQGKTTFAANIAYNGIFQGLNGIYVSMEMSFAEMRDMFYVLHTCNPDWYSHSKYKNLAGKVEYEDVLYGGLTDLEQEFFEYASEDFEKRDDLGELILIQPKEALTPSLLEMEIYDREAELAEKGKTLDFVIVDYVGLMIQDRDKSYGDFNVDLNNILKRLKNIAMTFKEGRGLRMITPFQVNREGWKEAVKNDGVYKLTALSNANEAERAADQIISLFMTDEMKRSGIMKIGCLKHRKGAQFVPFEATIDFGPRKITDFISKGPSDDGMGIEDINPGISADIPID